jgi:hypothetical protein
VVESLRIFFRLARGAWIPGVTGVVVVKDGGDEMLELAGPRGALWAVRLAAENHGAHVEL